MLDRERDEWMRRGENIDYALCMAATGRGKRGARNRLFLQWLRAPAPPPAARPTRYSAASAPSSSSSAAQNCCTVATFTRSWGVCTSLQKGVPGAAAGAGSAVAGAIRVWRRPGAGSASHPCAPRPPRSLQQGPDGHGVDARQLGENVGHLQPRVHRQQRRRRARHGRVGLQLHVGGAQ